MKKKKKTTCLIAEKKRNDGTTFLRDLKSKIPCLYREVELNSENKHITKQTIQKLAFWDSQ